MKAITTDARQHHIAALVAAYRGVPVAAVLARGRRQPVARVRQEAWALILTMAPDANIRRIGRAFQRDRTTVQHGLKAVLARCSRSDAYAADFNAMAAKVRQGLAAPAVTALGMA